MDKLNQCELEFEMIYHVASGVFEKVNIRKSDTKEILGEAQFSTTAAPRIQQNVQSPAPAQNRGAAAPR